MRYIIIILILFSSHSLSDDFESIQEKGKAIKEIIEIQERFANSFENHILQDFKISTIKEIIDSGIIPNNIDIRDLNEKNLSFTTLLDDRLKDDNFAYELYRSYTFRDKTYFNEDRIYFNISNPLAKLLYTLMIYQKQNEIKECPISFTNKIDLCHFENGIYVDITKYDDLFGDSNQNSKKPSKFLLAFNLESYDRGPIIVDEIDEDEAILNFFSNGVIFYDKDGIKYLKVADEKAKDKKFANLTTGE